MTSSTKPPILWKRGFCWLAFLGPFFFLSYGMVNNITSQRTGVGSYVYGWEHNIPFLPWLMLPYMSIDGFYGASLFLFRKRRLLDRHALRLLLATLISCTGFLLFPLRFSFEVPHAEGFNGVLQNLLLGLDKPYNQAPSLHISLLLILWVTYAKRLPLWARLPLHIWFMAIAASVVFVYQHHFIDVWTGVLVGIICLYAIPDPPFFWQWNLPTSAMKRIGIHYGAASFIIACLGIFLSQILSPWFWLLIWPSIALGLIAAAYYGLGKQIFQRHNGRMRWPAAFLLGPYLLGARLNYLYHMRHREHHTHIHGNIWLGAILRPTDTLWHAVLDMTNEFPISRYAQHKRYLPVMDLTSPSSRVLVRACRWIDKRAKEGHNVLVHCALGLSRSASVIACWLVWREQVNDIDTACTRLHNIRPGILLTDEHKSNIRSALQILKHNG